MSKHFKFKRGFKNNIPNLRPEIEIEDTIELRTKEIPIESEFCGEKEEKHTYYYDKRGILFPKAYLDINYEEID